MKVFLTVPDAFVLPTFWDRATPEQTALYLSLPAIFQGQTTEQQELLEAKAKIEGMECAAASWLEEATQAAKLNAQNELKRLEKENCNLREQNAHQTKLIEQQVEHLSSQTSTLHEIRHERKQLIAAELGALGENEVERVIANSLQCTIEDTSQYSHKGDRFVRTDDGMKLLQETKTVERLHSKQDVEKFYSDVRKGVQEGRINCALFISLKTTHIPNKIGRYVIEWLCESEREIPILFVCCQSQNCLELAIRTIYWLQQQQSKNKNTTSATQPQDEFIEKDLLANRLPALFEFVHQQVSLVDQRIRDLTKLLRSAERERARLTDIDSLMEPLEQIGWVKRTKTNLEAAKQILLDYKIKHKKIPNLKDLTTAQAELIKNEGGLLKIKSFL